MQWAKYAFLPIPVIMKCDIMIYILLVCFAQGLILKYVQGTSSICGRAVKVVHV